MLLEQLHERSECLKAFDKRLLHIESTLVEHQNNNEHPILIFSMLDPIRNTIARSRRLAEVISHFLSKSFKMHSLNSM